MSHLPTFLNKGDLIIVIGPSGVVNKDLVLEVIKILKNAGFEIEVAPNTFNAHFKFGATHEQRLSDLQFALDHKEAKAIYCARGGFGITHIIDELNWTQFKQFPKWIIGFSDITALLHAAYKNGFCSLHASVLQGLSKLSKIFQNSIFESLSGNFQNLEGKSSYNKSGQAVAELVGGNLSLLVHQIGTPTELDYRDKILFIEEVAEPLYHIDRMMLQLKRAEKLKGLAGLVIGQFSNLTEDKTIYGQSIEEIILAHCEECDFPIGFNFPFGHGEENVALVHGAEVELLVENDVAELKYLL
jgi:muramoyltetrapeptide carboxypeptidase